MLPHTTAFHLGWQSGLLHSFGAQDPSADRCLFSGGCSPSPKTLGRGSGRCSVGTGRFTPCPHQSQLSPPCRKRCCCCGMSGVDGRPAGSAFRSFEPSLALSVLDPKLTFSEEEANNSLQVCERCLARRRWCAGLQGSGASAA